VALVGDDPKRQARLKSCMDLGNAVTSDAELRYLGVLPNPRVPAFVELNSRLGWNVTDRLQVSLSGLLHDHHQAFIAQASNAAPRGLFAELRWRI
jgi:iron complex outermembrane receptor protein